MTYSAEDALKHAQHLANRGETGKARQLYQTILARHPGRAEAQAALATLEDRSIQLAALSALLAEKDYVRAAEQGEALAERFPDAVMLRNLLGVAYAGLKQPEPAIRHFRKALRIRPDMAQIQVNLGKSLSENGQVDEAATHFEQALRLKPDYADAHFSLGMVLSNLRCHDQAIGHFVSALRIAPDFASAETNLGIALCEVGRHGEAIDCFNRSLRIRPESAKTRVHLAMAYLQIKSYLEAISSLEAALTLEPDLSDSHAMKLFLQAVICDWDSIYADASALTALGLSGKPVQPFTLLPLEDNPERHRIRSELFAAERYSKLKPGTISPHSTKPQRLRIGYFSADFHGHAVLYQLIRVLELHDRAKFEIFAYSFGPPAEDAMRARVRKAVDVFRDVSALSPKNIAELARADGMDIAVDLMGYTANARLEIFAHRAAPVQIAYLGHPGTLGTSFMDYLIADRIIVPEEQRAHYAEKIIFMPHAHMATDDTRPIAERAITRQEMNLPEAGFVFCCFNNSYKISPSEFDIWMRLLDHVEGSVLWLAGTNEEAQRNLAKEAKKRGIDPERVIFSERVGMADHLARHRLADLFLDTFHYNSHSTAADALWAGLPVVTRIGRGFPARVAASLLTAIGLPELIAHSPEEYERIALTLARNPEQLAAITHRLHEGRVHSPLFDTARFTRALESGYRQALRRWIDGKPPDDIVIAVD